ncbi:MAG TPA: HD domain-containing phosphohydrolase [Solirubrobacteraceae bacterium]|nr:HD domain-containing phosphohydrolase [Solirubrobacteraceae bacterium]
MPELLIADDEEALRRWQERVVREQGGYSCDGAGDAVAVRRRLQENSYQLALLDVNMPGESGIELLSHIRSNHPDVAVLMVTGEDSTELALTAIEQGAYGYLIKPVAAGELLINVANALHRRRGELRNQRLMERLRETADERGHKLEEALQDLELSEHKVWASQAETIFRLARMVEFRDEETGQHLHRMSSYCEILARKIGWDEQRREQIRLASQLHDVGKVAVPDSILLKPGKLTDEEFDVIKGHAEVGYRMLAGSASEVVRMGAEIARTHHERWDGKGYQRGLMGEEIPVEGRIAAVADVFDALTSDRVYRSALPVKSAIEMMRDERGAHFDPDLLDAFLGALDEVEAIRRAYAD